MTPFRPYSLILLSLNNVTNYYFINIILIESMCNSHEPISKTPKPTKTCLALTGGLNIEDTITCQCLCWYIVMKKKKNDNNETFDLRFFYVYN